MAWGYSKRKQQAYPKGSTGRHIGRSSGSRAHRTRGQDKLPSSGIRHEGALLRHGYQLSDSDDTRRHEALNRAVKQDGYAETIKRLAALEGVHHGQSGQGATLHARAKSDIEYLQRKHG